MLIRRKKRLPLWFLSLLSVCLMLSGCAGTGATDSTESRLWQKEETAVTVQSGDTEYTTDRQQTEETEPESQTAEQPLSQAGQQEEGRTLADMSDPSAEETDLFPQETDELGQEPDGSSPDADMPEEGGSYTSRDQVAQYIHIYGHLPDNYITKKEAQALGWENSKGNLAEVAPGKSIGGDRFGNYEGLLPDAAGRKWTECDIDYESGYRNACRIIFSNDGLIYYTEDHYKSFVQLY